VSRFNFPHLTGGERLPLSFGFRFTRAELSRGREDTRSSGTGKEKGDIEQRCCVQVQALGRTDSKDKRGGVEWKGGGPF